MSDSSRPSRMAKYWDLFERLRDPTLLLDQESFEIRDANDACQAVLGREPESILGRSLLDLVAESDRKEFEKFLRVARRRYHPVQKEFRWTTADGRALVMDVGACAMALVDEKTEVIQILAKDITIIRENESKMQGYVLELRQLNRKLEELSITDELTGLANVRCFKGQLEQEHQRCLRYKSPYSVIFCDVDNFKHYNDTQGHPAGDLVLKGVAQLIQKECRTTDLAARYGGEEFVVLCPGVDEEGAAVLAERIRARIASSSFPHGEKQPLGCVSVSVGVANYPIDGASAAQVLERADQALYHSKSTGRNRVTRHSAVAGKVNFKSKKSA